MNWACPSLSQAVYKSHMCAHILLGWYRWWLHYCYGCETLLLMCITDKEAANVTASIAAWCVRALVQWKGWLEALGPAKLLRRRQQIRLLKVRIDMLASRCTPILQFMRSLHHPSCIFVFGCICRNWTRRTVCHYFGSARCGGRCAGFGQHEFPAQHDRFHGIAILVSCVRWRNGY